MLYSGRGREVWDACRTLDCAPFTLAAVGDIDWNSEMTPWPQEPVFKGDSGYKGNSAVFMKTLIKEIVPFAEKVNNGKPEYSVLAGYSLGRLFSLWSLFQQTPFTRFVSASGSLWFPDFLPYAHTAGFTMKPEFVYLSLGDKEEITKNRILASVGDCTRDFYNLMKSQGVSCAFEMNSGNHFIDEDIRTAKGIKTALTIR